MEDKSKMPGINICVLVVLLCNTAREKNDKLNEKVEIELSLFIDNMFVYIENPKESRKKYRIVKLILQAL